MICTLPALGAGWLSERVRDLLRSRNPISRSDLESPNGRQRQVSRNRRSTGTVMNVIISWPRLRLYRSEAARTARQAADVAAVDRGEIVTASCGYRGDYGKYPRRRYMPCWLDLAPDRPVIRPTVYFSFLWRRIPVEEPIVSARVRPFRDQWEAIRRASTGMYSEGGLYEHRGGVIIACKTTGGTLEFTVRRPDTDLVLHYLNRLATTGAHPDG